MRRLRYVVAMSLDGFIAGPNGESDWMVADPAMDFAAMHAQFNTMLMGRQTFEVARVRAAQWPEMGHRWIVVSRTLKPEEYPGITILSSGVVETISVLKKETGKDIWLCGGSVLLRAMLDARLVDTVEVAVMPVLLGSGVPLLMEGRRTRLHLETCRPLASGILLLQYTVIRIVSTA